MNLVRHRRNIAIILGLIIMNIGLRIFIYFKGLDVVVFCSYLSLNLIWIDVMRRRTEEMIKGVDKMIEDDMF